jgi:AmmeMemoRadiSam system protein A
MLTQEQRRALLAIAREAVAAAVGGKPLPKVTTADPALNQKCGVFVTLKSGARLRGCIGQFTAQGPLWRTVQEMARAAATQDPRFFANRIRPGEVPTLEIEISVLGPLEQTRDPMSLVLGKHGIYVKRGSRGGCFLPQVAIETGWSKEEFLDQCCAAKAGLSPGAWRDPGTEVYLFTAEVFGESDL